MLDFVKYCKAMNLSEQLHTLQHEENIIYEIVFENFLNLLRICRGNDSKTVNYDRRELKECIHSILN